MPFSVPAGDSVRGKLEASQGSHQCSETGKPQEAAPAEAAEGAGMSRPTLPMRKRRRNLLVLLLLGHALYFTLRGLPGLGSGCKARSRGGT